MRADEPDNESQQQPGEGRESIWSITPARRALYFGLFTAYALAGIGFLVWYEVFQHTADTWQQTILAITQGIGVTTVGAAGLALLTIEGPQTIMVVADYLRKKLIEPLEEKRRLEAEQRRQEEERRREEGYAKAKAEARAEGLAEGLAGGLAEGLAEGREEGRAENQAAWEAWNERRVDAEASGTPFNEPPPGTSSPESR